MLSARNVSKSYPTPRGPLTILTDISLTLERGEAIAIMGPSGSGKSTLLYILGALDAPSSGTVTIDGQDPFALGERQQAAFRNRSIGFVFQDHSLLPQCSVLENVLAPTLVASVSAKRDGNATTIRSEHESSCHRLALPIGSTIVQVNCLAARSSAPRSPAL